MVKRFAVLVVALGALTAYADQTSELATVARMRADLTFLASEACEGRGPGTAGIDKAADYIANAFKSAGLKGPMLNDTYFQPFFVRGAATLGPNSSVNLIGPDGESKKLKPEKDFQAFGLSGAGAANGPIVFVGYGISSAEHPTYDDYHGISVEGKVVLMIRRTPRFESESQPFADEQTKQRLAGLQTKVSNAEKHKAAAVIMVNDASEKDDALMELGYTAGEPANIPVVQIKRSFADAMLRAALKKSLAEIEEAIDKDLSSASAPLKDWSAEINVSIERKQLPVKNVIGVLEGSGPLAKETVVIGAHYDHLGYGGRGSGSLDAGSKSIHFGADDNGSGTTALIELARRFGAEKNRQGRRLVFIAFSGEELNLLGSKYYVEHPLFPLDSTVAMINMDMVGRLVPDATTGKGKLEVGGTGSAKEFDALIDKLNAKHDFAIKKNKSGVGPSDHTSFYLKGVPVYFLFTGLHKQYHRPADTVDLINFAGMKKITDLSEDMARVLATEPTRPEYVKGVGSMFMGGSGGSRVPRLGFMPGDYDDDSNGINVASVNKGGPGEKGGLKDGDKIIAVAGEPVKNMTVYMTVMGKQKRNHPVEITVERKGEKIKLTVTPQ